MRGAHGCRTVTAGTAGVTTRDILRSLDWLLVGAAALLCGLGLAMLFSAGFTTDHLLSTRFAKQVAALGLGWVVAFWAAHAPYHLWRRLAVPIYGVGLAGLLTLAFAGQVIRGTLSRLEVLGAQIQPSEFMKVALIVTIAALLSRRDRVTRRTFFGTALAVAVPATLVFLEPDIGMAALLLAVWLLLLLYYGLPWRTVVVLGLLGALLAGAAWQWVLADYQRDRLRVFLNPGRDPRGAGYNVTQSVVALGSGYWFGRGLGHGPQSQLKFLPEQHTDFIFSSIGEELGFVGIAVVLGLYIILLLRIIEVARRTSDPFGQLIAVGTFVVILLSVAISAGMNMGMLPVTGLPLPLLSYGGSNLVTTLLLIGLVQSVRVYSQWTRVTKPVELMAVT